jgi:hypothetical protein
MKVFVGFSRDHSGSMSSLRANAARDYNECLDSIKKSAKKEKQKCVVTTVKCGVRRGTNEIESELVPIDELEHLTERQYTAEGMTPLYDSVLMLIESIRPSMKKNNKAVALIQIITDGGENSSRNTTAPALSKLIKELQSSDRWTFVFRVPKGYGATLSKALEIPMGNILEWEVSNEGLAQATLTNNVATASFMNNVSRGVFSTKSFYQTDLSEVSAKEVRGKLENIKDKVKFWDVNGKAPLDIRGFCEYHLKRPMMKGAAFYQLTKTEKAVQDYKVIVIQNKVSGAVYAGAHARQLLGLPYHGSAKVVPGDHGGFNVFVQSTSVNRKLVPGTVVLYWEQNQIA